MIEQMFIEKDDKVKGIIITEKVTSENISYYKEIKKLCKMFDLDSEKDIITLPGSKVSFILEVGENADS